jgi:hypothetical protein
MFMRAANLRALIVLWRRLLYDGTLLRSYFDSTPAQPLLGLAVLPFCYSVIG